ncbi:hypothetical protein CCP2SC5_860008 [Azospirillaceae bacterium]
MMAVTEISEIPRNVPLFIFGAGFGGQTVKRHLEEVGVDTISGFIDNHAMGECDGVKIHAPDLFKKTAPDNACVIIASQYHREISAQLRALGINNVINAYPLTQKLIERVTLEQLYARARKGERVLSMRIDTVSSCQQRCRYCYTLNLENPPRERMRPEDFRAMAQRWFPKARAVALSCAWEPTMNRDFARIIEIAGEFHSPHLEFVTNGAFLTNDIIHAAIRAKINIINVSIDADEPELYTHIRGRNDFHRAIDALNRINQFKDQARSWLPLVNINWTAFEENADAAPRFAAAYNHLFQSFAFSHLLPQLRNQTNPFTRMSPNRFMEVLRRLREAVNDPLMVSANFNSGSNERSPLHCSMAFDNFIIGPKGAICIGCSKCNLVGNALVDDFETILEKNDALFKSHLCAGTDHCLTHCGM